MALLSLVADLIGVGTGIWLVYLGVRAALKKRSDENDEEDDPEEK